jgi:1,4-alpha-glucan branching enzyme
MYTHPGKKLLFMGCEVGQYEEWSSGGQVRWDLLQYAPHRGLQATLKRANEMYRAEPALHEVEFQGQGFEWIDINDVEGSVISFLRRAVDPEDFIVVVCNFTPVVRHGYHVGVPRAGFYDEILNTDDAAFWGSGVVNGTVHSVEVAAHGRPHSLVITLPPLGVTVLKPRR